MMFRDRLRQPNEEVKMAMDILHSEDPSLALTRQAHGLVIAHMVDARTGEVLLHWEKSNTVTLDAGILAARLFKNPAEPNYGAYMLAVGTGALGALLSPNAPDARQRKLNSEIARKPFSATVFRTAAGAAVAYPTNIVDFTATFSEGEAVGPLNEMGILSPVSPNPLIVANNPNNFPVRDVTLDITPFDCLVNYLTFMCLGKPSTATISFTWRLTF